MSDALMNEILARMRALGPDWHKKLADEMTADERTRLAEAIETQPQPAGSFVLIVTDSDKMTFSVEGPMVDDRPWNDVVVDAQNLGRQVRCHVPGGLARTSVEEAARVYSESYPDMTRVPAGTIVSLGS